MVSGKSRQTIGIVIPVFNDWEALYGLIRKLGDQAESSEFDFHIFLVDDGSFERLGLDRLSICRHRFSKLHLIQLSSNVGHQRAIAVGLVIASRIEKIKAVVVMDADGEDRPEDVSRLVAAWSADTNRIVVGQRGERSEGPAFRFFYAIYKLIFRITYNPSIWNNLAAAITRSRIPRTAIRVVRGARLAGKSRMNFESLVVHGVSAMTVYADIVLLRVLIGSALLAGLAVIAIALVVGIRIGTNWAIPGWASFLAASFTIIVLQALLISGIALFQLMSSRNVKTFVPAIDASSLILEVRKNRIATRRSHASKSQT
jgi:glycosyltransferase involved in cell wall biosynthesis